MWVEWTGLVGSWGIAVVGSVVAPTSGSGRGAMPSTSIGITCVCAGAGGSVEGIGAAGQTFTGPDTARVGSAGGGASSLDSMGAASPGW